MRYFVGYTVGNLVQRHSLKLNGIVLFLVKCLLLTPFGTAFAYASFRVTRKTGIYFLTGERRSLPDNADKQQKYTKLHVKRGRWG